VLPSRPDALRVLYVSPQAHVGGAERVLLDLLTHHDRAVVEPHLCFLRGGPLVSRCRDGLGLPTTLLVAPRYREWLRVRRTVDALARLIAEQRIDLVHSWMGWGHLFGGRAARRSRRPSVWFQHTTAAWRALDVRAALVRTRAIIANSYYTAETQRAVNPLRRPVHVIYPGTPVSEEPREARRGRGRAALGLADGEFAVGIAGRLQRWKGQDVVIRAAASLCRARPHARLFVIGGTLFDLDREYAGELRRLAAELGIAERTTFTGFRDDVPDLLAGMDVVVHASLHPEPFGLALVEAMAAGTPLVATDSGATREIVSPGVDGVLVPPGEHEVLAVALLELHDDAARRDALAAAGEATVRARFDAATMARSVEALYRSILPS
jgi:glycosyltransferase involved in cell wall biosynthesis